MLRALLLILSLAEIFGPGTLAGQEKEIDELASTLTSRLTQGGPKVVAVAKFTNDDGYDDHFSRFLAGRLTTELSNMASQIKPATFRVVDRAKTDAVLNELNLQYSKAFDAASFAHFGKGIGADLIVTGDFKVITNRISVNCFVLNTSMEVIGGKVFEIPRTAEVNEILGAQTPPAGKSSVPRSAEPSRPAKQPRISVRGFEFEMNKCSFAGLSLKCDLRVTNTGPDKNIIAYATWGGQIFTGSFPAGATSLFDNKGTQYFASKIILANKTDEKWVEAYLVSGVETPLSLVFENFPENIRTISLLSIDICVPNNDPQFMACARYENNRFNAQLRGIQIAQ